MKGELVCQRRTSHVCGGEAFHGSKMLASSTRVWFSVRCLVLHSGGHTWSSGVNPCRCRTFALGSSPTNRKWLFFSGQHINNIFCECRIRSICGGSLMRSPIKVSGHVTCIALVTMTASLTRRRGTCAATAEARGAVCTYYCMTSMAPPDT